MELVTRVPSSSLFGAASSSDANAEEGEVESGNEEEAEKEDEGDEGEDEDEEEGREEEDGSSSDERNRPGLFLLAVGGALLGARFFFLKSLGGGRE